MELPNSTLPCPGKVVIKPQRLMYDADFARPHMRSMLNGGYLFGRCSSHKVGCGLGQCKALAMSLRGIEIDESIKERQELLWQDLFLHPTQWLDNRRGKKNPRHPDFKHKTSMEALWLNNWFKPSWVDSKMAMWNVTARELLGSTTTLDQGGCAGECRILTSPGDTHLAFLKSICMEGNLSEAVEALDLMVQRGCHIDTYVFYGVLKRCTAENDLVSGRWIHALTVKSGYEGNSFLANHIICMYGSQGRLKEAMQVFTKVAAPSPYMWASIILAHARHGQATHAIGLYRQIGVSTTKWDNRVLVAVLTACATAADLACGKEVHQDILRLADKLDVFVGNCLVDMYAKCGSLVDARKVFDSLPSTARDVVTWNAMIAGYTQHGHGQEALALYGTMKQEGITAANKVTFVCLLQACAGVGSLLKGKQLHADIKEQGLADDVAVGSSLVDMYAKCGGLKEARTVFDSLPAKDVVTWNSMIGGYAQHGLGQEALCLYACMQPVTPDHITFVCLLKACGSVGALHHGRQLDEQIQELGLEADLVVGNSLVDMYAKCGSLMDARRVLDSLPTRDVVTWTALVHGYAQHDEGQMAIQCFEEMQQEGVKPNGATFISLLVACSHEGLLKEGQRYFNVMVQKHGIVPTIKHYTSMVDLLGRCGQLEEAEKMLHAMPFESDVGCWMSLLSSCYSYGDIERGRQCFDRLTSLDPTYSGAYVVLGNMYANADRWRDARRIESLRKSAGAWKKPAKACIEVRNRVHEFTVGEGRADVSFKLRSMNSKLQDEGGHVPHIGLVLRSVPEKEKEDALCGHAEKLAMAYGLLNTPDGTTLLVTKNLRMCNDCHSSTKIMSRLERREIIVRDAHRVHRFVQGSCSCRDRS